MKPKLIAFSLVLSTIFSTSTLTSCSTDKTLEAGLDINVPSSIQKQKVNETTYTLTATITPANTTIKTLEWSINFVNPNSTWASGKKVNDYVTLKAVSNVATIEMVKRFSEQIKITVSTTDGSKKEASCTVDCYKLVNNVSLSWNSEKLSTDSGNIVSFTTATYGDGIVLSAKKLIENQLTYEINLDQSINSNITFSDGTLPYQGDSGVTLAFSHNENGVNNAGGILTGDNIISFNENSMIINPAPESIEEALTYMFEEFGENIVPDETITVSCAGTKKEYAVYVVDDLVKATTITMDESNIKF